MPTRPTDPRNRLLPRLTGFTGTLSPPALVGPDSSAQLGLAISHSVSPRSTVVQSHELHAFKGESHQSSQAPLTAARVVSPAILAPKASSSAPHSSSLSSTPVLGAAEGGINATRFSPADGELASGFPTRLSPASSTPAAYSASTPGTSVASASVEHIHDYQSCLQLLKRTSWPRRGTADRAVTSAASVDSGYWNFGCQVSNRSAHSAVSLALPEVCKQLNMFLQQLFPAETWNTLCVAHNILTSPHRDSANSANSCNLSVSLGAFTGGSLWIESDQGPTHRFIPALQKSIPGKLVVSHNCPIKFPSHAWHLTEPFVGDRWVLTAFTMDNCSNSLLKPLGFPLKPSDAQVLPSSSIAPQRAETQVGASQSSSVNWGKHSGFGFKHHSWKPEVSTPAPFPLASVKNLPETLPDRFFLDLCSGVEKPLSAAVSALGFSTLSVDILLDSEMDLLQDSFFERLLFICGSGSVGYCAASPCCSHYSRLKLFNGPPYAIRTPEFLGGVPGLGPADLCKLQESKEILERCCKCVSVTFAAGGHGHIEQPQAPCHGKKAVCSLGCTRARFLGLGCCVWLRGPVG